MAQSPSGPTTEPALEELHDRLHHDGVVYFPVRHHSPACAWHLARRIHELKPASLLVEGPETFDRFLPHLADPELVAPVAVYVQFEERGRSADDRRRHGAFYPLCDSSPELVAIREGHAVGARVSFCDLDYPRQVRAERRDEEPDRLTSLLAEPHLTESDYLLALAKRRGCRDANELWDRLFESRFRAGDSAEFARDVTTYCYLTRLHASDDRLQRDGTLHREAHMVLRVERERQRLRKASETRPLLVVTGGFHTSALVLGQSGEGAPKMPRPASSDQTLEALVPYSFEQLDALGGYSAGMASPGYYQRLWSSKAETTAASLESVALDLVTALPARLRQARASLQLSTADAIAAFSQAQLLARTRGNPGPLREDLLDGMRSCFVKGELDVEGQLVLELALELMCGDAVGSLPAGVELHPLVADFRAQAGKLRLDLSTSTPREKALDIYRKPRHREISRFFHRLAFLDVPYARFVGGPDFVAGQDLDLRIEHWLCAWSPGAESALVSLTIYGTTVEDACVGLLKKRLADLRDEGGELGAPEAVRALVLCLRLGLTQHLDELIESVVAKLAAESALARCVEAAAQLQALRRFPGPFDRAPLPEIEALAVSAYQRSCLLIRDLPACPEASRSDALDALARLRELVAVASEGPEAPEAPEESEASTEIQAAALDDEILWEAAEAVQASPRLPELLRGGLVGLLYSGARLSSKELEQAVHAGLSGSQDGENTAPAFLQGLFSLCRELTWQNPAIMRFLDRLLKDWDDTDFHRALPLLRLAFAQHTPRETDRVAQLLAGVHGSDSAIDWYDRRHDEAFVLANVAVAARVADCLARDGLSHFLGGSAEP